MASITQAPVSGNAVIGQSSGPTMVINQSMVGIVEVLRNVKGIDRILGAQHGVRGIIENKFVDLQNVPAERLEQVANTPGAGLGSSRDKPDEEYCHKILSVLEENNVRYFFYIGGNDSSDTCRIVNDLAKREGYDLRAFHVPKTIDNDLVHNDHTPGFGSAAKFVAQAFMGDNLDNRALPGIKINIIMGRHAGFLTAASMLARQHTDDGPHLIYVPEVSFSVPKFLTDVEEVYRRYGRCLIAVSEGIHASDGTPMMSKLAQEIETDAHGNVQLSGTGALGDHLSNAIKEGLGSNLRVRADTFGYLQRSFAGCASPVDADEARAVGRKAAELALEGELAEASVTIQRVSNEPYKVQFKPIELSAVAGKTRTLDRKFIVNDCNISERFHEYIDPLVGRLPVIESLRLNHG